MKSLTKFVILTTVFLVFESCQEKNTVLTPNEDNYVVSLKEASNVAENIVSSQNSSQKNAKTGATKKIKQQRSVLDESDNQSIMHIFNYENNEGFIIISGDKRLMPYIAYSSTGEFDLSLSKPGINLWASYVKEVVKLAKSNKEKQHPAAKNAWNNLDSAPANISTGPQIDPNTPPIIEGVALSQFVAPIISSTWNQDDAYNFDCPTANGGPCNKAFTGCVATAMAQVIRRWQFPSNSNFNYSLMGDACDHTCSPNNNDLQVAYLMSFCGNKVGMSYGASSSSASTSNVPNALKNMGYSNSVSYTGNLSYYNLDNNILNNWPVIMRGDNGSASGHAWVCDGLARYNWYFGVGIGMSSWAYYHMNWGWGGYCNGWYAFGSINPNSQGTNIGLSFNQNMKAVINIHP